MQASWTESAGQNSAIKLHSIFPDQTPFDYLAIGFFICYGTADGFASKYQPTNRDKAESTQ
jgi:hypothetical protein